MHALIGDGVLASSDAHGIWVAGEVEVIDFNAANFGFRRAVGVDADEEIGLRLVGDGGPGFERDEGVVGAGVDNFCAETIVQKFAKAESDVEHDIFFADAADAEGAGIVATMTGVNDDAIDF